MGKRIRTGIISAIGIFILILDSKTALQGGIAGIEVCLMQVIPALLPFFVLTMLLSSAFSGADIPILRPVGKFCRMPRGSESLLILGLLGGYPAGAQSVAEACRSGQLRKEDAQRLLGFCSNAGPAFLFGIASVVFPDLWFPWALWLIHILSALITGVLLPGGSQDTVRLPAPRPMTLPTALEKSIVIMAKVCGWIVIFRMIQAFLEKWFLRSLGNQAAVAVIGFLELANGCMALPQIEDLGLRAVLCSAFLAMGGLCVAMQTLSVIAPLRLDSYINGKLLQTAISTLLTLLMVAIFLPTSVLNINVPILTIFLAAFVIIFTLLLRKYEKNSSILQMIRV